MTEVALALGGGGARGLAHIHVLEAPDELGIRPVAIAGSSIGAIMGAGYASGMTGGQIRKYALKTLGNRTQVMSRLWQLRPDNFRGFFSSVQRFGELNGRKALRAFLPDTIPDSFSQLQIPLKITATDFFAAELKVLDEGDLWQAMAASAAIPSIFRPEIVDGRYMIDGGIINPVPFELVEAPGRIVIAVDVVGKPRGSDDRMPTRVESLFGASQLMMHAATQLKLRLHRPAIFIRPRINEFRVMDFLRAEAILERSKETRVEVRTKLEGLLRAA